MDSLSAIRGLSFDLPALYQELSNSGWQIKKVKYDSSRDLFVAVGQASHGEELESWGPSERVAVSNLLMNAIHRNGLRTTKVAAWSYTFTDQMRQVAEAYSKAPIYEPKAAIAFMELGRDAQARAETLMSHLEITITNNPEAYNDPQKMCDDIRKRRKLEVSRAGIEHPIWSTQQALAFRITFDVLGYCASGGGWDWEGTNRAFAAYAHLCSAEAQKALFTQVIGQTAYTTYYRAYGPQKIALFPQFLDSAQEQENPHKLYRGVHPSQSYAPLPEPRVKPLVAHAGLDPLIAPGMAHRTAGGLLEDPNEGWTSGVAPLPQNAYLDHGDPLELQRSMDTASLIDTEWAFLNQDDPAQLATMKYAVTNAFRAVLLSPRKDLRWNAVHYQDIAGISGDESDPTKYWHTLEQHRQNWNVQRYGEDARYQHMPYYHEWKDLEQLMYQKNPRAGWPTAIEEAKHFLFRMQTRVQEQVMAEDADKPEDKQRHMYQIELESNKRLTQALKLYIKEHQLGFDFEARAPQDTTLFEAPQEELPDMAKYGSFMGTHLQAIAQISEHVNEILQAALFDVHNRDGAGHHFRASVLQLQVPGVGPKVCSFAWLLLQPVTSQLATIDAHIMGVLGHNAEKDMSPRDYFKFERELAAGRDAGGYGAMPLGAFQWSMWDTKRTGPGSHQDHSALKVLDPLPHDQIDWQEKEPPASSVNWPAPDWWQATQPARDAVAAEWDQTVAPNVPANQIPYNQGAPMASYAKVIKESTSTLTPWLTHPATGERMIGLPGQTIAQHAQTIGMGLQDLWQLTDDQVGKS